MRRPNLIAALALLLCSASAAVAANTPKGDWLVGPINAASSSGVGYCSMKNEYRDGHTLVFARDAEGSNSLAIDFHKKILETGGQYNLVLHVGPLERQMQAIAATPSVIIIQMGLDRDFYAMLQRKASLTVDFQTSRLSFGLDGTRDGLAALTTCAQAVGSRKHFAQTKIPLSSAPDEEYLPAVEPAAGETPVLPPATFPQQAQVIPPGQTFSGNLGVEAAQATLKDQLEALKAENRKLLLENQRVAESLQTDEPPRLAVPAPLFSTPTQPRADNVTAALAAAQQGIQQALEAQQAQAEDARRQAGLAAENARLRASLEAAQAQAEESRKQAAMIAENAKLREALAAEQLEKQRALETARTQAAEVQRQAAIATENARLKASLEAVEQEKQRAQAQAAAAAQAEAQRQAAVTADTQKSKITVSSSRQPAAVTLRRPAVAEAPKPAVPRVSLQVVGQPDDFIQELLTQSHVTGIRDPRNPGAYTWSAGGVDGIAEEQDITRSSLTDAANEYVLKEGSRCHGDFAHNIGAVKKLNGAEIIEGELACMNGVSDAAAAVLFVSRNGRLAIITHAGPPSRMEKALSSRDEMVSVISQ